MRYRYLFFAFFLIIPLALSADNQPEDLESLLSTLEDRVNEEKEYIASMQEELGEPLSPSYPGMPLTADTLSRLREQVKALTQKEKETNAQLIVAQRRIENLKQTIAGLKKERGALNDKLKETGGKEKMLTAQIAKAQKEIDTLKRKISGLQDSLKEKDKEKQRGATERKKTIEQLRGKVKDTARSMKALEIDLAGIRNENVSLRKEIDTLQKRIQEKNGQAAELEMKMLKAMKNETEVTSQLNDAQKQVTLLKRDKEALEQTLFREKERYEVLQKKYDLASELVAEKEKIITPLEKKLNSSAQGERELLSQIDEATKTITRLNQDIAALTRDKQDMEEDKVSLMQENTALHDKIKAAHKRVGEQQDTIKELKAALSEQKGVFDREAGQKDLYIAQLKKKMEDLAKEKASVSTEYETSTREIARLKKELAAKPKETIVYKASPQQQGRIDELKKEIVEKERQVSQLEHDMEILRGDIEKTRLGLQDKLELLEKKEDVIGGLQKENERLVGEKQRLAVNLQKSLGKIGDLSSRLNGVPGKEIIYRPSPQAQEEILGLKTRLAEKESEIEQLKSDADYFKKSIKLRVGEEERLAQEKDARIEELKKKIESKMAHEKELIAELEEKSTELSHLKRYMDSELKDKAAARVQLLADKEDELAKLKLKNEKYAAKEKELAARLDSTQRELAVYKGKLSAVQKELKRKEGQVEEFRDKDMQILELKRKLSDETARREEAESTLEKIKGERNELKDTVQEKEGAIRRKEDEISALREKNVLIDQLQMRLEDALKRQKELVAELKKKEDEQASTGAASPREAAVRKLEKRVMNIKREEPPSVSSHAGPKVTIHLTNGTVVEGVLMEETGSSIRINSVGIPITYFKDDISSIERVAE